MPPEAVIIHFNVINYTCLCFFPGFFHMENLVISTHQQGVVVAVNKMAESNVSVPAVNLGDDFQETKNSTFMNKCEFDTSHETRNPCLQLDENEEAISTVKVMNETGVNHLLVSGVEGKVVGIVSSFHILKLFLRPLDG